ncbi:MAG: hypothetical protein ACRDRK_02365 [Pseudonocardia sp.]
MTAVETCRAHLRVIATRLRASLVDSLNPDQQAYATLVENGELHPWTGQAETIWTQATSPDPWRAHHLAVLHHAKAYDLEMTESPEAFRHWTAALGHWSAVHADDAFWARMARHLREQMGAEIAPEVVAGVRTRLPRELLEPHRDLIAAYRASDPERARRHMLVVKSAPFDPGVIDGIRLQFVDEVVATVPDAVETADFESMLDGLRGWLHIDEDNAHLLRSLLYAYRQCNEQVWDSDDGLARVAGNVAEAQRILTVIGAPPADPAGVARYVERLEALRPAGLPQGALTAEIARHELWSGLVSKGLADQRFSWESDSQSRQECERDVSRAVKHYGVARLLDPHLTLDHYYSVLPSLEACAESLWGLCLLARQEGVGAAQHLRRATTLDPSDAESFLGLAQALLTSDDVPDAALVEAEHAISRTAALVSESGNDKSRAAVQQLRRLLALQRARNLGA